MDDIRIMVVDDEEIILESIRDYLTGYSIDTFIDPMAARIAMKENYYDIIVTDYRMPGMNGLDLLKAGKSLGAYYYGILLTAYADKDLLEDFINRNLIMHILEKPLNLQALKQAIDGAIELCNKAILERTRIEKLEILCSETLKGIDYLNDRVIGLKGGLKETYRKAQFIADTDENVLITGETGTGKEVIARMIHTSGSRRDGPFIKINCGAIPENLIESELFGYMKGAFSGAHRDKPGRIELADEGTLFLDEIGELSAEMQTRLLQVVQEKRIVRVGGTTARPVNFRLICATNRDLLSCIKERRFREDLYFRIATFPIHVPPLRERREDIEELSVFLLNKYKKELGRRNVQISQNAVERLEQYAWPGNIREMENALKRAVILLPPDDEVITESAFDTLFSESVSPPSLYDDAVTCLRDIIIRDKIDIKKVEHDLIASVLEKYNGNIRDAVHNSGIPKDRFYRNR